MSACLFGISTDPSIQRGFDVAAQDPLTYYQWLDISSRAALLGNSSTRSSRDVTQQAANNLWFLSHALQLPNLLVGEGHKELLPSWQHYRGYSSAYASWMKAWVKLMQEQAGKQGGECWIVVGPLLSQLRRMLVWLLVESSQNMCWNPDSEDDMVRGWRVMDQVKMESKPTPLHIQLLLLLWSARGIAAAGMLLAVQVRGAAEGDIAGASSSSSSSSKGSSSSASRTLQLPAPAAAMRELLHAALALCSCLAQWQEGACKPAPPAAAVAADVDGAAASSSSSPPPCAHAAKLPKRLSKLPQQGLPTVVAEQLGTVMKSLPEGLLKAEFVATRADTYLERLSAGQQKVLMGKLAGMSHVLLAGVPTPLGCSNPACVSLGGESEVRASNKACTSCKSVYYCSRECQVGHWQIHKMVCKELQGKQEEAGKQQEKQKGAR